MRELDYNEGFMDGVSACCQMMTNLVQAVQHKKELHQVKLMVGATAIAMAEILNESAHQTETLYEQKGNDK